ncbi:MAG: hypothetical protein PHY80_01630 [Rickettsiales bacterium]|nr:hypothetical protein [Rickettsiales bacterium]
MSKKYKNTSKILNNIRPGTMLSKLVSGELECCPKTREETVKEIKKDIQNISQSCSLELEKSFILNDLSKLLEKIKFELDKIDELSSNGKEDILKEIQVIEEKLNINNKKDKEKKIKSEEKKVKKAEDLHFEQLVKMTINNKSLNFEEAVERSRDKFKNAKVVFDKYNIKDQKEAKNMLNTLNDEIIKLKSQFSIITTETGQLDIEEKMKNLKKIQNEIEQALRDIQIKNLK